MEAALHAFERVVLQRCCAACFQRKSVKSQTYCTWENVSASPMIMNNCCLERGEGVGGGSQAAHSCHRHETGVALSVTKAVQLPVSDLHIASSLRPAGKT